MQHPRRYALTFVVAGIGLLLYGVLGDHSRAFAASGTALLLIGAAIAVRVRGTGTEMSPVGGRPPELQ